MGAQNKRRESKKKNRPSDGPPKRRAADLYAGGARDLATHLHKEYRRIYDNEVDPLTEPFGTSIGHAKRLLKLKFLDPSKVQLHGIQALMTWWLAHWNDAVSVGFERHDFSMAAFVAKYTVIRNRYREWHDARAKKARDPGR